MIVITINITSCKYCHTIYSYIYTTVRLYTTVNKTTWFSSSCRLYPTHAAFINNDDVVQGQKCEIKRTYKKDSDSSIYDTISYHWYYVQLRSARLESNLSKRFSLLRAPELLPQAKLKFADNSRMRFSRVIFFNFMRPFWNQIFTCLSVRWTLRLISRRLSRVRYMLKRNSFSSSKVWCLVYGQRFFRPLFAVNQLAVLSLLHSPVKWCRKHTISTYVTYLQYRM